MKSIALVLFLASTSAAAQEDAEQADDYQMAVSTFVRCAGLYEWTAQLMENAGKPNAAEHMRGMRRGAKTTAAWFAANQYVLENPSKPPRPLGAWDSMLDPQIESEITRVKGLSELGDNDAITAGLELCTEASKVQADVVNSIRKNVADQAEGEQTPRP